MGKGDSEVRRLLLSVLAGAITLGAAISPAPVEAHHKGSRPKILDYQVVMRKDGVDRVCWDAWIEDRDGTYFMSARYFSQCAGLYYNWNPRTRIMSVSRRMNEVDNYQLEAWPVESDRRTTFNWRESFGADWKRFALENDHLYESQLGTANMIPIYLYTAAFDMFYEYDDAERTVTIHLDQSALPKRYDAARAVKYLKQNGNRMDLVPPASGVWDITPAAWRHAREYGLSAQVMSNRLRNEGVITQLDPDNLRIRLLYPGASRQVYADLYPSHQYSVLWFRSKGEAEHWITQMKAIGGGAGVGGTIGSSISGVASFVAGATAMGITGITATVGFAVYGADRYFTIDTAEHCVTLAEDANGEDNFSMGFAVTARSAAVAHVTGCVTEYTNLPVNPGGLHH